MHKPINNIWIKVKFLKYYKYNNCPYKKGSTYLVAETLAKYLINQGYCYMIKYHIAQTLSLDKILKNYKIFKIRVLKRERKNNGNRINCSKCRDRLETRGCHINSW